MDIDTDRRLDLPPTRPGGDLSSSRAEAISQSLRAVARRSRNRGTWMPVGAPERRWQSYLRPAIMIAFFFVVAIPNLFSSVYLAFIASDQYASETRFAVRGNDRGSADALGGLGLLPSTQRIQDSLILADYIEGRGLVEEVDRQVDLRKMFAGGDIDFLSRFKAATTEELVNYWKWKVNVSVDKISGIITMIVRAFTPEDSLRLSQIIIDQSEKLVNELSERSRQDWLRMSRMELELASKNLQAKLVTMRDLRNTEGVLDTKKTSEVMTEMQGNLRMELIKLEQQYAAQRKSLLPDSPQLRVLNARIASMREQVQRFESQMTNNTSSPGLAQTMGRFDRETLEREIAQRQYIGAAAAFERARLESESQLVYLSTFQKPTLAQEALYPRRFLLASIVAAVTLALWGAGTGIAIVIRDYVAV